MLSKGFKYLLKRPLSLILGLMGVSGIVFFILIAVSTGSIYIDAFDKLDGTTLIMISVLLIQSVWVFRQEPDSVSFGNTVVICLSFIYIFEGVYKFLFFDWLVNPADLRELLLQIGVASTVILLIGLDSLRVTKAVIIFFTLYVTFMFVWWIFGYPQIFEDIENRVIFFGADRISVSLNKVFIWNRITKLWLFLAFVFAVGKKSRN